LIIEGENNADISISH